jgi:hypothetical protein
MAMPLMNDYLVSDRPHPIGEGVQRIYRFNTGFGLSVVNAPMLHAYAFAWEVAVIKFYGDGPFAFSLCYDSGLTGAVEVFSTDTETNDFIHRAIVELG